MNGDAPRDAATLVPVLETLPAGISESEREGVFVNGFICQHCGLHFNLFSWKAGRHRVDNTFCPECGRRGAFIHYRRMLSDKTHRDPDSKDEIFRHVPWPGSQLINDSVIFTAAGDGDVKRGGKGK